MTTTASTASVAARLNRLPIIPTHRRVTFIIGVGLFFEFYEFFLIGVLSTTLAKEFRIPKGSPLLSLLIASTAIGMLFGAIGLNYLADRVGRRTGFLLNLGIYSLFSLLAAFSPNVFILIILRFFAGLGIGAELPLCDAYLSDMLPARSRGPYIAWAYTLSFLGLPLLGLLASLLVTQHPLGLAGWRWLFIAGSLGAAIVWVMRRSLPESPRWLESVDRIQEANTIVERMEAEAKEVTKSELPAPNVNEIPVRGKTPLRVILQPPYNGRVLMLSVFHFFEPFSINGFGLLVPLILTTKGLTITTSLAYSAISYIGYPLGSLLTVFTAERIERKWLLAISGLLMVVSGIAFGFSSAPAAILSFGFVFAAASTIFSDGWHIYQGELFPTSSRATAAGLSYSISRLSTALLPFILVPVLFRAGPVAVFAVIGVATLIAIGDVVLFGPRTTGRPLEEVNPFSLEGVDRVSPPVTHNEETEREAPLVSEKAEPMTHLAIETEDVKSLASERPEPANRPSLEE